MWICPDCRRSFRNQNQWHSCISVEPEMILSDKPGWIQNIFNDIKNNPSLHGVKISPSKSTIFFKNCSTFLAFKPGSENLKLEFYSDKKIDSPLIKKSLQISKNRVAHSVIITGEKQFTKKLTDWIIFSYNLIKK